MLSIAVIRRIVYYLELARQGYYLEGGEPPGIWIGEGCRELGLKGLVQDEDLRSLLLGFSPQGIPLVQNAGSEDRQGGWDLTFSPPKPVDVVWAASPDWLRYAVQSAHLESVKVSLQTVQAKAGFTRRGKGGKHWDPAKLIVAAFEHGTSRASDPKLHTHCLVLNLAVRSDGSTGSLLSKPIYKFKMAAGAIYRAELARRLRELEFKIVNDRFSFKIDGVPDSLTAYFSKRRQDIEDALGKHGKATAQAAAMAALTTRTAKESVPRSELFREWQQISKLFGFDADAVEAIRGPGCDVPSSDPNEVARLAVAQITSQHATFSESDLICATAQLAIEHNLSAEQVLGAVEQILRRSPEVLTLGEVKRVEQFTTREMLEIEAELLASVDQMSQQSGHLVSHDQLDPILSRNQEFSEDQVIAVDYLTTTPGDIKVVDGMPGTGKTRMLSACREAWELAGYQVLGCSVAAKAAWELESGSGIPSVTVAKLIHSWNQATLFNSVEHHIEQTARAALGKPTYAPEQFTLNSKTVLVIDEAGMIDTRQLARIQTEVEQAGAKLVMVGDHRQLPAIGPGGAFHAIADRVGCAELTDMRRQSDVRDIQAIQQIAHGEALEALQSLQERGLLMVAANRQAAMEQLVSDWKANELSNPRQAVIMTATNQEAAYINKRCQEARLSSTFHNPLLSLAIGDERFYTGDRLICLQNSKLFGVNNGDLGTVVRVDPLKSLLTVKLDKNDQIIQLNTEDYGQLKLAYARTTYKEQGNTIPRAYVLMGGPMQTQEATFVQVSRHVETLRIYTDQFEAGPGLEDLATRIEQSQAKQLAHSVLGIALQQIELDRLCMPVAPLLTVDEHSFSHAMASSEHIPVIEHETLSHAVTPFATTREIDPPLHTAVGDQVLETESEILPVLSHERSNNADLIPAHDDIAIEMGRTDQNLDIDDPPTKDHEIDVPVHTLCLPRDLERAMDQLSQLQMPIVSKTPTIERQ